MINKYKSHKQVSEAYNGFGKYWSSIHYEDIVLLA